MRFLDSLRGRSGPADRGSALPAPSAPVRTQEEQWRAAIARQEWLVLHVPAREDGTSPAFQYTAGLTERGLPELVVYGLRMKTGTLVLDDLAWRLLNGEDFGEGAAVPGLVQGDVPARLWTATWQQDLLDAVRRLYGDHARVRQVVVPDDTGRLPFEAGYATPHLQPVLFTAPDGTGPRRTDPAPDVRRTGAYSFGDD